MIVDLATHQVTAIPGSENLYSPRWSPDGQYLAALPDDSKKLLLFSFKTQKWSDWVSEPGRDRLPQLVTRLEVTSTTISTFTEHPHFSASQGRPDPLRTFG